MNAIKNIGLVLFLVGMAIFSGVIFLGSFRLSSSALDEYLQTKSFKSTLIAEKLEEAVVTDEHLNIFEFSNRVRNAFESSNTHYHNLISRYDSLKAWDEKAKQYSYLVNEKPHVLSYELAKKQAVAL